jgi:uncharacterized membrane protein YuzA (DUF378 family)
MKKYIISIFTVLLGISMTSSAIASTNITLSPSTSNVVAGQKIEVTVYANANGTRNGTVKTNVEFPADLLEVTSFTQPSIWMSIKESGYESEDNTNGVLIKTAGYPRGFSSNLVFGTITFTAKKVGVATVKVTTDSAAYDVSNKNVYSGISQSVINITAPGVIIPTTTVNATTTTEDNSGLTGQEAGVLGALDGLFGTSTDENLTASVFGSMMSGKVWYIVGIIILLGLILWFLFWIKRRKEEEDKNKINK